MLRKATTHSIEYYSLPSLFLLPALLSLPSPPPLLLLLYTGIGGHMGSMGYIVFS